MSSAVQINQIQAEACYQIINRIPAGAVSLRNETGKILIAYELPVGPVVSIPSGIRQVWVQANCMCGTTGPVDLKAGLRSYGCLGIPATTHSPAQLIGILDLRNVNGEIEVRQVQDGFEAQAILDFGGMTLDPGREWPLPKTVVLKGASLEELFEQYGEMSGRAMHARVPETPVYGWCSWYHYYGHETETDILNNARELKNSGVLPAGAVIQIDDGWNLPEEGAKRNWGDWMPGAKFPRGMKAVADDLHALGFRAGIWLAPFSADAASELARTHPDWLLSSPGSCDLLEEGANPVCGLDLTNPDVLAYLDRTFERVFNEWGYDYVKLDFLLHAMANGRRHNTGISRTESLHNALQRIRQIAGDDRFILCCGSPFGPAVGVADAMRVGFDVGSRWHAPMNSAFWPYGNCSIKPAAFASLHCQWMNGHWWMNDPDCLMIRGKANRFDPLQFNKHHPGGAVPAEAFGLNDEEAGCWARLIYATGTFYMLSEVWNELPPQRRALARQAFRLPPSRFRTAEAAGAAVPVMRSEDGMSFAVFNLGDDPATPALPPGWKHGAYVEEFSGEELNTAEADERLPEMPPHSGRIWTYQSAAALK